MFNRLAIPALITTLAVAPVVVSCSSNKVPLSTQQQMYAGKWVASDGTFVNIYLDGGGDFKTSNSEVTGGTATITDKTLKIGLGPIKKEFKITQPPQEQNGKFTMQLDGITYTNNQSSATNPVSSSSVSEVKSTTTEEKSQAAKEIESKIIQSWGQNFGGQLDSLNCPSEFEIKADNSINCQASVENIPFQMKVNFQDNEGSFNWEAKGLLVLAKVEDKVVEVFRQSYGAKTQADCSTSRNQKYRPSIAQDTFECKASDGGQNTTTVKITVQDDEGSFQLSPIS
ncbi:DUF4333 domain-containing protein [Nostoc sp. MS1]|uniref:DUF4333 domain-containing protein n=1 Tax=Nostoc sp. MS1 TaxID=2764711 RepID=UPI001CC77D8E|nr:DUF4333 domain-containing protein [Nostoc sp. MS1]